MSLLSGLFKNDKNNRIKAETKTTRKLSINEIPFTEVSKKESDKIYEEIIRRRKENTITQAEDEYLQRKTKSYYTMDTLSSNGIILYRMAKSDEEIARKSLECWEYIEHKPNSVVYSNPDGHGLSMTSAENLILCIPYGDMVTEVVFNQERLKQNNLLKEPIYKIQNNFNEYIAINFLTGNMYSISNPSILKMVIDMSSNNSFEKALQTNDDAWYSIKTSLQKFEFFDTLTFWDKIKDRYNELDKNGVLDKVDVLRMELADILKQTPTVANDMFNNSETFNITTEINSLSRDEL